MSPVSLDSTDCQPTVTSISSKKSHPCLRTPKELVHMPAERERDEVAVGNQHKWDSLGPERSGVGKSLGELPEGPVMK